VAHGHKVMTHLILCFLGRPAFYNVILDVHYNIVNVVAFKGLW